MRSNNAPRQNAQKRHGELRRSQVVTTFGPGVMLDLPNYSVLVAGLDEWTKQKDEIVEPRLSRKLAEQLDLPGLRLYSPPIDQDLPGAPMSGVLCYQFPEWFVTQDTESDEVDRNVRSRRLVHRKGLTRGRFIDEDRKRRAVVPVRFVRACRRGHIGDIDWYAFAHDKATDCRAQRRSLWIDERGTSGDLADVSVRCECGASQNMAQAAKQASRALGYCDGFRPWLGQTSREPCDETNRLLIRTASNAYFPEKMSVISLPDRDDTVNRAIDAAWEFLQEVEVIDDLRYERRKVRVKAALEGISDEEAFAEIQRRRSGSLKGEKRVKVAELETLVAAQEQLGEDRPDGTFYARALPQSAWDAPWMEPIERVVLVHRLREVVAQVGFTRFDAASTDIHGELEVGVQRAALAREITWLPAIENRGEGVFLQFHADAVEDWAAQVAVMARGIKLMAGFDLWNREHPGTNRSFPGLPYLMLHSFAHMVITALSLDCGYPASSIRERIYAEPGLGYGVLLFTGTSDAEGTLGGLVDVSRRIHTVIGQALQFSQLCSNDPVCAQHDPPSQNENRFLQGAACHGCLLIAETSCEQHNDFLDRALVVPTVENLGAEFFPVGSW